jgi:hypothetical protein
VSEWDFGKRKYDKDTKKLVPKHCNTQEMFKEHLSGSKFKRIQRFLPRLNNDKLARHWNGETHYFTGKHGGRTLVLIDLDAHEDQGQSLADCLTFEAVLKKRWPSLYCESSTNDRGRHCFFILDSRAGQPDDKREAAEAVNEGIDHLQAALRAEAASLGLNIGLDVCGKLTVFDRGEVESGTLGKIPQDRDRFEEWRQMPFLKLRDILKMPAPDAANQKLRSSSFTFDVKKFGKYDEIAKQMSYRFPMRQGTVRVCREDLKVGLWMLEHLPPKYKNKANPTKRFRNFWKKLYANGIVKRQWDGTRWKLIRNAMTESGFIKWHSRSYCWNPEDHVTKKRPPGRCCRWEASELFLAMVQAKRAKRSLSQTEQQQHWSKRFPLITPQFSRYAILEVADDEFDAVCRGRPLEVAV